VKNALIDKSKTALVVIDLQKGIVGRQTAPYASDIVVKNTAALAEAFRKNDMPVFLVRVTPSPDGKDTLRPIADAPMQAQTPPSDWADIVPELGPKPGDFVITKHQWGAFYGTELDLELRRRGMATIVLCGIATNIGVESTARFAYEYGYKPDGRYCFRLARTLAPPILVSAAWICRTGGVWLVSTSSARPDQLIRSADRIKQNDRHKKAPALSYFWH
jgi:nicotinamidase-related amidase